MNKLMLAPGVLSRCSASRFRRRQRQIAAPTCRLWKGQADPGAGNRQEDARQRDGSLGGAAQWPAARGFRAGRTRRRPGRRRQPHPGFAGLLAGLLSEGTEKRDSRAIAETAQGLGGSVGAGAGNDGITVSANALASKPNRCWSWWPKSRGSRPSREGGSAGQGQRAAGAESGRSHARLPRRTGDIQGGLRRPSLWPHAADSDSINSTTAELLKAEHAKRFRPDRGAAGDHRPDQRAQA